MVPFITEEIWQVLGEAPKSISIAEYPTESPDWIDEEAEERIAAHFQSAATSVWAVRAEENVPARERVDVFVNTSSEYVSGTLVATGPALEAMTGSNSWQISVDEEFQPPEGSTPVVLPDFDLHVLYTKHVDVASERNRLEKLLADVESDLARAEAKLANEQFLSRAPADVVEKERRKRDEFAQKKERLEANLASLGA